MVLIVSIISTGGYEVHIYGKTISCYRLANPILILLTLLMLRFLLEIGRTNSLTLIGSFLFAAVLGEITLRLMNPPMALPSLRNITESSDLLGYRMVPHLKDKRIKTNSHGLRDREYSLKKTEGIKRVLGIGDSFTFGYQVALEDSYLKQLEKRLNIRRKNWEVINAGVSGYNMWQYLAYFEHYGYQYEPNFITLGIYFDDFYGDPSIEGENAPQQRYRSFSFLRLVNFSRNCMDLLKYRFRYIFNAAWLKSIEERRKYILESKYASLLHGEEDPGLYKKFELRLKKFVELTGKHDARTLVIFIPDIIQLNSPEFQVLNRILKDMCHRYRIDYLDMTPLFENTDSVKSLYLLPHDAHTSPLGHKIIAREIEKRILEMAERQA